MVPSKVEKGVFTFGLLPEKFINEFEVVPWIANKHRVVLIPGTPYGCLGHVRISFGGLVEKDCQLASERPTVKGVGLCVADSHTSNHPEGGFTPLETIQRLLFIIGRRSHSGFEGETFKPEMMAYGGEPTVDLLWSFLNRGPVSAWLTLSNRGSADVPMAHHNPITHLGNWKGLKTTWKHSPKRPVIYHRRSFMFKGVDGEFNFYLRKMLVKRKVAFGIPEESLPPKVQKMPTQASKVVGEASTPLDVDSDSDIYGMLWSSLKWTFMTREHIFALHKAKTSYDAIRAREFDKDRAYAELERKCIESERERLKSFEIQLLKEIDSLKQDRAAVVSRVIPDTVMKHIRSDDLGVLITKHVRSSIIYGRCQAFKEVADMEEPFILKKMSGY
uniref:Aspartate aminotransferase n=1 Tax=Tanacetum cinerariifolium TaxID=118510 RepID=A0A6L2P8R9_TANCI|nr:aspartate aminotransferase [Tanacetum cinerariifolium]